MHAFLLPLGIFCPLLCLSVIDVPFLLPFGIFRLLFCLSFIDLRLLIAPWYLLSIVLSVLHWCTLLITPWYLLSIVLSVFHWLTPSYYPLVSFVHCFVCSSLMYPSYYPLVSFVHCFVCPSLIYAFLLPLGIFCPLFCLSFIDLSLLITPWYLLSIILSVLHWFTPSYYPLVSFVHCFVCPSLIYAFLLPLGIFCPLFCLSLIDLRLLITPWYLLFIVFSVLHWYMPSYYPLVSFVHCFVCPCVNNAFLLPLGIFCP